MLQDSNILSMGTLGMKSIEESVSTSAETYGCVVCE